MTTEFKVNTTEIPGLLKIDVSLVEDSRGYFQEKFQKAKLVEAGLPTSFNPVQQNISFNKDQGIIRGLHAEPWNKYISIVSGKVFAVFVDLRKENFGKKVSMELDEKTAVFLPEGVANSYQTLVPNVYYSYLVDKHWSAEDKYISINVTDPELGIDWPISLSDSIISDKDKSNPMLKETK